MRHQDHVRTYACPIVSGFNTEFKNVAWGPAQELFRFVDSTAVQGILHRRDYSLELSGYCDADYAEHRDRRSVSGPVFLFDERLVDWHSKR